MKNLKNLKDFAEIIEPAFIEEADFGEVSINGDYIIGEVSDEVVQSINPIEVPMVDGSIGVFDTTGEFMGFKN